MKSLITYLGCCAFLLSASGCGGVRETSKTATKATVETVRDTLGGIQEGIDEGRTGAEGVDGAVVVTTHDEAAKYLDLSIVSLAPASESGGVKVVLGALNRHDEPVRMTNLQRTGSLLLVDKNEFATHLRSTASNPDSITIQPNLKEKFTFVFDGEAETIAALRVYGHEYAVTADAPDSTAP